MQKSFPLKRYSDVLSLLPYTERNMPLFGVVRAIIEEDMHESVMHFGGALSHGNLD